MTTKITYGFLAIAMVAVFSLALAPTMQSAHATTTYVTSFGEGQETCANSLPPANNYGTANSDGDLTGHSDTDGSSSSGVFTAWAWNKVYFTSGTSVTMLAKGTVDIDVTDGHAHVSAYLAISSPNEPVQSSISDAIKKVENAEKKINYIGLGLVFTILFGFVGMIWGGFSLVRETNDFIREETDRQIRIENEFKKNIATFKDEIIALENRIDSLTVIIEQNNKDDKKINHENTKK